MTQTTCSALPHLASLSHQKLIFYSSGIPFWLVTLSSDVTREPNIPPSSACIKALLSEYRSPRQQSALGSAGTASATGNLPSKVTASPAAPHRALSVYRASSKGHGNQRLLLTSTHNCPTHSFDLVCIFILPIT